jgi:hypothetical protein
VSLLGELVAQDIGEAALDALVGTRKPHAPFPEGETKASYGAASAFFGTLGLLFALPIAILAALTDPSPEMSLGAILTMALVGLVSSVAGMRLGARAPLVTRRNLGFAKYGFSVATVGALSAVAALVACAVRAIL